MKNPLVLLLALIMTLSTPSLLRADEPPPGQIGVAPSMFELAIGQNPVNESVRIFNLKKIPTTVKVEVYNWTLDEKNEVKLLPPDKQSLDRWMLINPLSFTLDPGKSQVVRFSIRPTVKPDPGEHRAIIYFIEQPATASVDSSKALEILFKLGVGVYGYADPVKHAGVLSSLSFDKSSSSIVADIANSGNVHTRLKGNYSIWKKDTFPGIGAAAKFADADKKEKQPTGMMISGQLNQTPVLPGSRRTLSTQIPMPKASGSYILAVNGSIDGKAVEKTFVIAR
ncbi:MAG: molecular chaperone [Chlorobium sp.]|uniref:molecular chaperone n=1 Tax=Chlorobium sp. TaxID=1095 RepID=UPI0025C4A1D9|nr:molecular chaperone [Chlorobium sp.]MCF8383712.1 molecular chaperone [Chlorobium sp.]